jgi:hypothetical protein
MGQWGTTDNANGSVLWAAKTLNKGKGKAAQAANNAALYGSTTANAFVNKQTIGQFGVSVAERRNAAANSEARKVTSPGWNLRRVGSGGRAGRVTYECLVSLTGMANGATDDAQLP